MNGIVELFTIHQMSRKGHLDVGQDLYSKMTFIVVLNREIYSIKTENRFETKNCQSLHCGLIQFHLDLSLNQTFLLKNHHKFHVWQYEVCPTFKFLFDLI